MLGYIYYWYYTLGWEKVWNGKLTSQVILAKSFLWPIPGHLFAYCDLGPLPSNGPRVNTLEP